MKIESIDQLISGNTYWKLTRSDIKKITYAGECEDCGDFERITILEWLTYGDNGGYEVHEIPFLSDFDLFTGEIEAREERISDLQSEIESEEQKIKALERESIQ